MWQQITSNNVPKGADVAQTWLAQSGQDNMKANTMAHLVLESYGHLSPVRAGVSFFFARQSSTVSPPADGGPPVTVTRRTAMRLLCPVPPPTFRHGASSVLP